MSFTLAWNGKAFCVACGRMGKNGMSEEDLLIYKSSSFDACTQCGKTMKAV